MRWRVGAGAETSHEFRNGALEGGRGGVGADPPQDGGTDLADGDVEGAAHARLPDPEEASDVPLGHAVAEPERALSEYVERVQIPPAGSRRVAGTVVR